MKDDNDKYYATMCGFWFNPDSMGYTSFVTDDIEKINANISKPFVKKIKIDKEPEYTEEQIKQAGSLLDYIVEKERSKLKSGGEPTKKDSKKDLLKSVVDAQEKQRYGWLPTKKNSSLDIAAEMAKEKYPTTFPHIPRRGRIIDYTEKEKTNTQEHYKGKDSLYKFCDEWKLNAYEFDILKRIVRCRHKGNFEEDLDKTIDLIKIYKKEQKDLHGK